MKAREIIRGIMKTTGIVALTVVFLITILAVSFVISWRIVASEPDTDSDAVAVWDEEATFRALMNQAFPDFRIQYAHLEIENGPSGYIATFFFVAMYPDGRIMNFEMTDTSPAATKRIAIERTKTGAIQQLNKTWKEGNKNEEKNPQGDLKAINLTLMAFRLKGLQREQIFCVLGGGFSYLFKWLTPQLCNSFSNILYINGLVALCLNLRRHQERTVGFN